MERCPKVGDRVRYNGRAGHVGACTGTVTAIYRSHYYDEDALEAAETDAATLRAMRGLRPESEWHVAILPDVKPSPWAYGDNDKFAPEVSTLTPVKAKARTVPA